MKRWLILAVMFPLLCGCESCPLNYTPTEAGLNMASALADIEQLIMRQDREHRPKSIAVTDSFMVWDWWPGFGQTRKGGIYIGKPEALVGTSGEKINFSDMADVRMMTWHGRWYVVFIAKPDGEPRKYIFYTRSEQEAQRLVNAMLFLIHHPDHLKGISATPT